MANLFIAMGGSGLKTVLEIRNKQREGDYFLFVDTDTNDLHGFSEREKVDLSEVNVTNWLATEPVTNKYRKAADKWLDSYARATMKNGPLKDGASANRPQGRLAIASIAENFKNKLKDLVRSINNINQNDPDGLRTYIVLSVAGGTGSSIYLDLTQIIYDELYLLKQNNFSKPTAVFYMPDVFVGFQRDENVDRYKTNVFAFWKELDAIQRDYFESINMNLVVQDRDTINANASASRSTNFSKFAIVADPVTNNNSRFAFQAFQSAILIDHENAEGKITVIEQRYKDVARLLEMISVRTYGGEIRSALDNSILPNAVSSLNNKLPWVKQYWSAGYAEIRGGSELFEEYVKTNLKAILYEQFLGVSRASKDGLEAMVNPLFQDNLLCFIENDNFSGYNNKAREENNKKVNLHALIDLYWMEKIEGNLEKQYLSGVEMHDDTSADGLKRIFDNDIKGIISEKLLEYLNTSGFQVDGVVRKILGELYENSTEIALTEGLKHMSYVFEELDTKIDDLSMNYDAMLKDLANQKANIVVDDQDIINRSLADTIISQYATIKEGPSFRVLKKKQWYETELTTLKKLIKAEFIYQAEELALKLKKEICDKISFGQIGDMFVRANISKLISSLQTKIDVEVKLKSHKNLIAKYLTFKNNALTSIVPDVSRFSETHTFEDPKVNVFKRIFENECGLATGIKNGKTYFIVKKSDKSDANSKSIEEFVRLVFKDSKYLLNNVQSGEISDQKFIEEFERKIEENLISKLKTELTQGQSQEGKITGYPKFASYSLNEWINEDSASFNAVKKQFEKRASVFCNLVNINVQQQIWLSPISLKNRIDEIYSVDGDAGAPKYNHTETNEDAIISIKYVDNLSFDNYLKYTQYKDHYKYCLSNNINNYYPHIDVRFKNAMANSLHDVEDQTPILNVLKQGMSQPQNSNDSINKTNAIKFLENYSNFYFLAKFYESLNNDALLSIYKNLVMSDGAFSDKMSSSNRSFNPPVFIENGSIKCFLSGDINRLQDKGYVWMSGTTGDFSIIFEELGLAKLNDYFQRVILLGEQKPEEWNLLEAKANILDTNFNCIKKRYAMSQDKSQFKKALTDTINLVKSDIMKLSPSEDDYKLIFNDFYVKFSSELSKFI